MPGSPQGGSQPPLDAQQLSEVLRIVYAVLVYVRGSPFLKLVSCLAVDVIGFSSFLLPGLGELGDIGWAPLQACFIWFMFGSLRAGALGFFEEILPGTDFVPSATLAWASENVDAEVMQALRVLTGVTLRRPAAP